jgi:PadR family transcriptional regulator PadR
VTEETPYTRKFRKELMAGLSSLVLLAVLARAGREMYGYEIAKAVKAEGEGGLIFKQGAIYPVLRSLNATGLLHSRVEASAFGPPRRYYDITEEGRKALSEWQFAWRDMREFVDDALKAGTIPGATQDGHAGAAA